MKILYGTGNPAKLSSMKHRLEKLDIELMGLIDLKTEGIAIPEVPEDGYRSYANSKGTKSQENLSAISSKNARMGSLNSLYSARTALQAVGSDRL